MRAVLQRVTRIPPPFRPPKQKGLKDGEGVQGERKETFLKSFLPLPRPPEAFFPRYPSARGSLRVTNMSTAIMATTSPVPTSRAKSSMRSREKSRA